MVAISIPGIPGYCQYLHTRTTLLQSVRPLQASVGLTNQRKDWEYWPMRGQQGVDHETIVNTDNIFNLQDFFWSKIKLEFECVVIPWTRCVLHSSSHVKIYLVNCKSISNQLNEAFPNHDCLLTAKKCKGCLRPCCGSDMDEAANVDWCCFKTLFI